MHEDAESGFDKLVGARLRDLRRSKGWSQRQLAEALDGDVKLDPSAITRIERGERSIKLREAAAIANVLDVGIYQLVTELDNPHMALLKEVRRSAHREMQLGREAFSRMATDYALAVNTLASHPEILTGIEAAIHGESKEQFLVQEAEAAKGLDPTVGLFVDADDLALIREIILAAVSNVIALGGSSPP